MGTVEGIGSVSKKLTVVNVQLTRDLQQCPIHTDSST